MPPNPHPYTPNAFLPSTQSPTTPPLPIYCLITEEFHPILSTRLSEAGIVIDCLPEIDTAGVMEIIEKYQVIIVNSKIILDANVLSKAKNLKVIGRVGSGLDIIDLEYCRKNQIEVCSSPEGNANAVGEHALGLLLSVMNNITRSKAEMPQPVWDREGLRGEELDGKTVAIIGYGHTGQAFAKKLRGFDVELLVYDKYIQEYGSEYARESGLDEIFQKADIVSLHLPLTAETKYFADKDFFEKFKKSIILINTSRGKICKTEDLMEKLVSGKVKSAGLDVFENEKPKLFSDEEKEIYDNLFLMPNVVSTPHIAGWTIESKYKLADILTQKVLQKLGL
jgi:D-3-phosphoglycerate dehydrogenase / 2-oxoglutarate reductase